MNIYFARSVFSEYFGITHYEELICFLFLKELLHLELFKSPVSQGTVQITNINRMDAKNTQAQNNILLITLSVIP